MKLEHKETGDILEVPPPDILGRGVVKLNGCIVLRVLYSDEDNSVTLPDGQKLSPDEWSKYIVGYLRGRLGHD